MCLVKCMFICNICIILCDYNKESVKITLICSLQLVASYDIREQEFIINKSESRSYIYYELLIPSLVIKLLLIVRSIRDWPILCLFFTYAMLQNVIYMLM